MAPSSHPPENAGAYRMDVGEDGHGTRPIKLLPMLGIRSPDVKINDVESWAYKRARGCFKARGPALSRAKGKRLFVRKLGMDFQIFLGPPHHILLAPVGKLFGGFFERNPEGAFHLDPHLG